MIEKFSCKPQELIYVGDEKKDIDGINKIGGISILIDRENKGNELGQRYRIQSLNEIINIIK